MFVSSVVAVLAASLPLTAPTSSVEWPPPLPVVEGRSTAETRVPPSVRVTDLEDGTWHVRFRLVHPERTMPVALTGSFNGWDSGALPMERRGRYVEAHVVLPDGVHPYKFVVGGDWRRDPENPDGIDDGHGGQNSVLRLGALANLAEVRCAVGDGVIDGVGVQHDPGAIGDQQCVGAQWVLRMRTFRDDVSSVRLVTRRGTEAAMSRVLQDDRFDWWEARVPVERDDDDEILEDEYVFLMSDGAVTERSGAVYDLQSDGAPMRTPEWAKDAIWYQIMVDRFRNGRPENDPDPVRPWRSAWYEPSPWEGRDGQTFYDYYVFSRLYGGDLFGLMERLDYLADLGVNALYLNPVFQSESHHKYNATSFVHIDEYYGVPGDYAAAEAREDLRDPATWTWTEADRVFLDFLKLAKAKGFRVIIDGVFNHVGTRHPAFRDVRARGLGSPYADWFNVTSWDPFEYHGWAGFGELPEFRKDESGLTSDAAKQHIFDITTRWMDPDGDGDPSDGIDGWRLDVPNEVALPFWVEWCAHVRSINPDAYIVGEIWDRADMWLDGQSFDAVMNYQFARIAIEWIGNVERRITTSEAEQRFAALRLAYPAEATYVLQNLIDSHDTDRLVSMLQNPDRGFDEGNREQETDAYDGGKPSAASYQKARLVAFLQMVSVGAPMIYYGDEVGMWGADDPTCRKPMLWRDLEPYANPDENHVMDEHLAAYRAMVHLRRDHVALRRGSMRSVLIDDQRWLWGFERETDDERLFVLINASTDAQTVTLPAIESGTWRVVHGAVETPEPGRAGVGAWSGAVWVYVPDA